MTRPSYSLFLFGGAITSAAAFHISDPFGWVVVGLLLMVVALDGFPE